MKNIVKSILITTLLTISSLSLASPDKAVLSEEPNEHKSLRKLIAKTFPDSDLRGVIIADYKDSGVPGISEFALGSQVLYVTNDHSFLFLGSIFNLTTQENIKEKAEKIIRLSALEKLGENNMLIYKPKQRKHYITVFTDVDCYYCQKLHTEMEQYMEQGVAVRYIFRPLKGQGSLAKSVGVWCSKDPLKAMTTAKNGQEVLASNCANPIGKHIRIGDEFGIRGTPAIILENGKMIPGYKPAKDVVKMLEAS